MAKMYVQAVPPPDLNKNTEWFMYPGVWSTYIFILFVSWLLVLSVFGCTPGMAWTLVNLSHFAITYHFFHWKKGTPFSDDQGMYNRLTWWEQMDNELKSLPEMHLTPASPPPTPKIAPAAVPAPVPPVMVPPPWTSVPVLPSRSGAYAFYSRCH